MLSISTAAQGCVRICTYHGVKFGYRRSDVCGVPVMCQSRPEVCRVVGCGEGKNSAHINHSRAQQTRPRGHGRLLARLAAEAEAVRKGVPRGCPSWGVPECAAGTGRPPLPITCQKPMRYPAAIMGRTFACHLTH